MLITERRAKILEYIESRGQASVAELASFIYASEPTVRRDLTALEREGALKKVFGGAISRPAADREIPLDKRMQEAAAAKDMMARRACEYVHDGDVILMDGSTSAMATVPYLARFKELIAVTSGARTAIALGEAGIRTFCTGGMMITNSFSFTGSHAQQLVESINADILFFSCHGYSDGVATDLSLEENTLRRVMMKSAKKKILLCDSSKHGKVYMYNLCRKEDVDAIITE